MIAIAAKLDKFSTINSILTILQKKLLNDLFKSYIGFLLNNHILKTYLEKKIKHKMKHLWHYIVIAYFVGSKPLIKAMQA